MFATNYLQSAPDLGVEHKNKDIKLSTHSFSNDSSVLYIYSSDWLFGRSQHFVGRKIAYVLDMMFCFIFIYFIAVIWADFHQKKAECPRYVMYLVGLCTPRLYS